MFLRSRIIVLLCSIICFFILSFLMYGQIEYWPVMPGQPNGFGGNNSHNGYSDRKKMFENKHAYLTVAEVKSVSKVRCKSFFPLSHGIEHLSLKLLGYNGVEFVIVLTDNEIILPGNFVRIAYIQDHDSRNIETIFHITNISKDK